MDVTILDSDKDTGLTGFFINFNNQPFLKTSQLRCATSVGVQYSVDEI